MDQLQISPEIQQGLQNLSAKDKQELNQFIVGETQKAQVQSSTFNSRVVHVCASTDSRIQLLYTVYILTLNAAIHELNSVCFKKCITGRMSQGSLERNEDTCMKNCVDRYMDANMMIIKHLERMRM
jgi:import inner membrane translocase subunit TIM8